MLKKIVIQLVLVFVTSLVFGQEKKETELLLNNLRVQMECTEAIDSLYNGNFLVAEKQFGWLQEQYPDHPLGDFLMALSQKWKIMPNTDETKYDERYFKYLEITIDKAKKLYKKDKTNPETTFILAAAYGMKSQRLTEKGKIMSAIGPAEKASDYITENMDSDSFGPEFMLGTGLYNYFRVWIPQHKKSLKPILMAFRKGDAKLGLRQLNEVANLSFYSRIEALVYLVDIYNEYGEYKDKKTWKKDRRKAYEISKNLYKTYDKNRYFERRYAELAMITRADVNAGVIIMKKRVLQEQASPGTLNSETYRKYTHFYGNELYRRGDKVTAVPLLTKMVDLSVELDALERSYTLATTYVVAKYYADKKDKVNALKYYEILEDNYAKRGQSNNYRIAHEEHYEEAKKYIKENGDKKFLGIF